jgi:hypothetical protein
VRPKLRRNFGAWVALQLMVNANFGSASVGLPHLSGHGGQSHSEAGMFRKTIFTAALICACGTAQAQTTDDFNRDDAPGLGENYTTHNGAFETYAWSAMGSKAALATYNGSTGNHATLDLATDGYVPGSYAALTFGYLSGQNFFIKVQDSDGDGWFDHFGFLTGNNVELGELQALNPFGNGTLDVTVKGTTASLTVWTEQPRFGPGSMAKGMDDGWIPQTYSFDYGFAPGSGDIGLGLDGQAIVDNFSFDTVATGVPEPTSWAMLILGFGLAGAGIRSRRVRLCFA